MSKPRSERQRWTAIFTLYEKGESELSAKEAKQQHHELFAVVSAFEKVGRIVRVETTGYGKTLSLKARRA